VEEMSVGAGLENDRSSRPEGTGASASTEKVLAYRRRRRPWNAMDITLSPLDRSANVIAEMVKETPRSPS